MIETFATVGLDDPVRISFSVDTQLRNGKKWKHEDNFDTFSGYIEAVVSNPRLVVKDTGGAESGLPAGGGAITVPTGAGQKNGLVSLTMDYEARFFKYKEDGSSELVKTEGGKLRVYLLHYIITRERE